MSIAKTLSKIRVGYLAKFILLLALATGAPILGIHSQWLTGPLVNMALILSVFLVGIRGAVLIGLLPSTIALGTGLLPVALAPMVPFIIISNVVLVLMIDLIVCRDSSVGTTLELSAHSDRSRPVPTEKYWFGLLLAAGLKFFFLFLTSSIVIKLLLNEKLAPVVAQMMSWPQFYTALIGGILAFIILRIKK